MRNRDVLGIDLYEKNMTTETTSILRMQAALQAWEGSQQRHVSSYEYEKTFVDMWQKLGAEVFQQSMGKIPCNRNLKKNFKPV